MKYLKIAAISIIAGLAAFTALLSFVWGLLYFIGFLMLNIENLIPNPLFLSSCHWNQNEAYRESACELARKQR